MIIKNLDRLLSHGYLAGREVVLDILQAGLAAPDPYENVKNLVRVEGRRLIIDGPGLSDPPGQPPLIFDLDQEVLHAYQCWDQAPESVRAFLLRADPQYGPLRPEESHGKPHYYFRVMGPEAMLEAARVRAVDLGLNAVILASSLNDVEAQPVAHTFAFMANEIERLSRPVQPPCVLICGGELVVTVGNTPGVGGRNQEFVLTTAPQIANSPNIVIASVDSEGTDGPTDKAGGIVDGLTMKRASEAGLDLVRELARHNSNGALETLGDAIHTGILPTNVRDLRLIYIGGSQPGTWIGRAP